jgi:formylmethanofuran dehydrogenase subunit B
MTYHYIYCDLCDKLCDDTSFKCTTSNCHNYVCYECSYGKFNDYESYIAYKKKEKEPFLTENEFYEKIEDEDITIEIENVIYSFNKCKNCKKLEKLKKENDDLSILANKMKILVLTNQLNRHELKKIYQYL